MDFCRLHATRGNENAIHKRISPINCQSNLVTQKIQLPRFYGTASSYFPTFAYAWVLPYLTFFSERKLALAHCTSRFASFSPCNRIRCSFSNDRVKCKYRRVCSSGFFPLEKLRKVPNKTLFGDEERKKKRKREREKQRAFCHFKQVRKYVVVESPFTSWICLFNAAIKSERWRKEFSSIVARHSDISVG